MEKLLFVPAATAEDIGQSYPIAVSVADGTQRLITAKRWNAIIQMSWLADGSGLLMNAKDNGMDATRQIWHVSYPNGEPQRIYNDDNEYDTISLSGKSGSLVSVRRESDSNIWVNQTSRRTGCRQTGNFRNRTEDGYWGMDTTPDGKVIMRLKELAARVIYGSWTRTAAIKSK